MTLAYSARVVVDSLKEELERKKWDLRMAFREVPELIRIVDNPRAHVDKAKKLLDDAAERYDKVVTALAHFGKEAGYS